MILDIGLNPADTHTVEKAMRVVGLMNQKLPTPTNAIPSIPASGSGTGSSHVRDLSIEALSECVYGVEEHKPKILAATSLCGVIFSQGMYGYVVT